MKKFLNLFFILTTFILSFSHFAAPAQGIAGAEHGNIACHCDSMKGLEQLSEAKQSETYMIDCATADTQTRDHNGQVRTAISSVTTLKNTHTVISFSPAQEYTLHNISISQDTPPPRHSA